MLVIDFSSGCHPDLAVVSGVVVASVESMATEQLDRQCLGSPLLEYLSVKDIVDRIVINQGLVLEGPKDNALTSLCGNVKKMISVGRADNKEISEINEVIDFVNEKK